MAGMDGLVFLNLAPPPLMPFAECFPSIKISCKW